MYLFTNCAKQLVAALVFITLSACGSPAADPVRGLNGHKSWVQASESSPIIEGGALLDRAIWNDPSVIKVDGDYVMYLSSSVNEPFEPPVLPFRAISKDGKRWTLSPSTPVLDEKGTDFVSIETPSVIYFNGHYIMFYSGIYADGTVPSMAIGRATSSDGVRWTHDPEPVLTATGDVMDWNGYLVAEPGAMVLDGKVFLYFTAMGARLNESKTAVGYPEQLQSLGLAVSSDGKRFLSQQQILTQGGKYPSESGFVGYSTPAPLQVDGRVHLVYDIAAFVKGANPQWQQVALHRAVSQTGRKDFVEDSTPILTRNDFAWTSGELLAPALLVEGDTVKMWFAGHVNYDGMAAFIRAGFKGPEFGIGYTEISKAEFLATMNRAGK